MFEQFDLYCERTSPDFWAEPVNALTNVCFLIAAWFVWRRAKERHADSRGVRLLLVLMCCIGIGSFLFHTFATLWARILDVVPILLFQLAFAWLYFRKVIRVRFLPATIFVVTYLAIVLVIRWLFGHVLNGSMIYAPAMLLLLALGLYHLKTRRAEPYAIAAAAGVFAIAVTFRSIDHTLCSCFPLGTHFMWHILNPIALYLLISGLPANQSTATGRRTED